MEAVSSKDAPAAIGPYSQAIKSKCGEMIFLSGQVPLDPKTGEFVESGRAFLERIATMTERVLDNLSAVLEAAGCTFANVVRTTIYLTDLGDFAVVNQTYAKRFREGLPFPARATVQVAALPKGAKVEIDAIAMK